MVKPTVFLGLGSNLGESLTYLRLACRYLEHSGHTEIKKYSSVYKSPPAGYIRQPDFLNAVLEAETRLKPLELLDYVKWVEESIGRKKNVRRWGPRIIDIDILSYGNIKYSHKRLTIPHKELNNRVFWNKGIREILGLSVRGLSGCRRVYAGEYLKWTK